MKQVLMLALFLSSNVALAAGWAPTYPMSFSAPRKIAVFFYQNAQACKDDGGEWESDGEGADEEGFESGMCFLDGGAHVDLTRDDKGQLAISIGVVGTNAHTCEFEGPAKMTNRTTYVSKVEAEDYNGETDQFEKVTCEVTVKLSKGGREAAVSTNGKCSTFCGMRASLEFEEAKLVK